MTFTVMAIILADMAGSAPSEREMNSQRSGITNTINYTNLKRLHEIGRTVRSGDLCLFQRNLCLGNVLESSIGLSSSQLVAQGGSTPLWY